MIGKKIEMSQIFHEDGTVTPVTILACGKNQVRQVKTEEKDGYQAVQMSFDTGHKKDKRAEFEGLDQRIKLKVGQEIAVDDVFQVGDVVAVTGTSKGKGFAGVVKRYGFAGGPKTHGQSDRHRAPGSIGAGTDPGRVWKGHRMAGRMGQDRVTVKGLKVIEVDAERGELKVTGAVPGSRNSAVIVRKQV